MTDFDDDVLARALRNVPVGGYASIEQLRARARQVRTRRRIAGAGLAVAAAVVIAVPSALAFGGNGSDLHPQPAQTNTPTPSETAAAPALGCPQTYAERYDTAEPHLTTSAHDVHGPGGLPADVRLLWPDGAAAAPSGVSATDHTELNAEVESFYAECPPLTDQSVLLVDLDGDVVTRTVRIRPTGGWRDVDSTNARTLDVGSTQVRINDTGVPEADHLTAEWELDGVGWSVQGNPLSEEELSELVRTMRVAGGRLDVSGWPVAAAADHVFEGAGLGPQAGRISYEVQAGFLTLSVDNRGATPWLGARPGTLVTEVAGEPALLSEMALEAGWEVTWQPSAGVTATLSGDIDQDELLQLAEMVAPVPPDEARLAGAWGNVQ